jgi:D-alanyl-D-alanine carboxypeptidase/D-alanyl-D-alanine-endopeptidase (penicillin-binding protein 4)
MMVRARSQSVGRWFPWAQLCLAIALAASSTAAALAGGFADRIKPVITAPEFKHAHWGILFVDLEKGEVLHEHNADKLFVPASTTKLYTVATALDAFGPSYRFETPVYARGKIDATGKLDGDLILVAKGDLTMGGRTDANGNIAFKNSDHTYASNDGKAELTDPDPLGGLKELARQVAAAGIKRVSGQVLVDDRYFEQTQSSGSGPTRVTPIIINDNVIDLVITPGKEGEVASVTWRPQSPAMRVDARVETVAAGGKTDVDVENIGASRIVVRGTIAAARKPLVMISEVQNPTSLARALWIDCLRNEKVVVDASPLSWNPGDQLPKEDGYEGLKRVALLTSPPFSESAKLILKVSHNLHASTLPLLVARKQGQRTLEAGLHAQHDFLKKAGVEVETISFSGGAGGSRADYTTPRATVQLLRYMATRRDFDVYHAALPILGVDGTLAAHAKSDSPAKGKVHAKTGTLYWTNTMNDRQLMTSKALAGYMTASSGRRIALALFVNNVHAKSSDDMTRIGQILGRLCEFAYESW